MASPSTPFLLPKHMVTRNSVRLILKYSLGENEEIFRDLHGPAAFMASRRVACSPASTVDCHAVHDQEVNPSIAMHTSALVPG
jgi:hypothetical protein